MTHPIYVCRTHKLTFHTSRVAGRHAQSHSVDYITAIKQGIFKEIGQCDNPSCNKDRLIASTPQEFDLAVKRMDSPFGGRN